MMLTENAETLAFYPIRTLSALTGVNARTIRAWERRYELLTPFRTDSGHRLYTDEHVNTVKEVVRLLEQGVPISRVKPLLKQPSALKIHTEEQRLVTHDSEWPAFKEELIDAALKQDLATIEKICREVLDRYPFDVALRYLFMPTRNDLTVQSDQLFAGIFDFVLTEKLLNKVVANYPSESLATILVCSDRGKILSIEALSLCWALVNQRLKPVPFMRELELLFPLKESFDGILIYMHSVDIKSPLWESLKKLAVQTSAPIFIAGIFDKESLGFIRNIGLVPLHEDARKSALLMADILSANQ